MKRNHHRNGCPNCGDAIYLHRTDIDDNVDLHRYRCESCAYWQNADELNEAWMAKFAPRPLAQPEGTDPGCSGRHPLRRVVGA